MTNINQSFDYVKIDLCILILSQSSNPHQMLDYLLTSDAVNPELEAAKEILGELCDIGSYEVDEMIRLRMERLELYDNVASLSVA